MTSKVDTRIPFKTKAKDWAYDHVPLGLVGRIVSVVAPGSSPFEAEIVRRNAIFVHVPKAAGTSIKTELYGRPQYGHRRIAEFYAYDPDRAARYFKFGFVRNPWDRLLSAHSYLMSGKGTSGRDNLFAKTFLKPVGTFEEFVLRLETPAYRQAIMSYDHFRSQAWWVCLPGDSEHALDLLGRFEAMEASALVRSRSSQHSDYRDAYSERMKSIVRDVYQADIALFDYRF